MSIASKRAQREAVRLVAARASQPTAEPPINRHLTVQSAMRPAPARHLSKAAVHLAATARALAGFGRPVHHEHLELAGKRYDALVDDVGVVSLRSE